MQRKTNQSGVSKFYIIILVKYDFGSVAERGISLFVAIMTKCRNNGYDNVYI